jgi:hypothetical protein
MKEWRRLLPGPKHGMARGVGVFGSPGFERDADGLHEHLGQCQQLRAWAEGRGLALSSIQADLRWLDQEIDAESGDAETMPSASEVGLFLGTVIINSSPGAQWRVWPNGHPVVRTASGRELDVVALANLRFRAGAPLLADAYADAVGGGTS